MNYSKIVLITIVFFLLGMGWYLLSNNSEQTDPQTTSASVYSDSLPDPERPTITAQKDTMEQDTAKDDAPPPPAGEKLAPGTALVKAVIVSTDLNGDTDRTITITAEEILGYGSSISPIGDQQELTVSADRFLKNNPAQKKLLVQGGTIYIVIASEKGMNIGGSNSNGKWSLVDLK